MRKLIIIAIILFCAGYAAANVIQVGGRRALVGGVGWKMDTTTDSLTFDGVNALTFDGTNELTF